MTNEQHALLHTVVIGAKKLRAALWARVAVRARMQVMRAPARAKC
jgi:hypothetical protein